MTMTFASNFFSNFFSKIRKFCKKALLTRASFILFLVSLAILKDEIYKIKGHDCEPHIALYMFLEGVNRELATFTLGINTTDPLKHATRDRQKRRQF